MGTVKIGDVKIPCMHPEHFPPNMVVWPPGVYQHTCPSCGSQSTFTIYPVIC